MTVYYQYEEKDVWESGSLTSRIFLAQCEAVSKLVGVPCGLDENSDEVDVDPGKLEAFCFALLQQSERCNSKHVPALLHPCLVTCLYLLGRLNVLGWKATTVNVEEIERATEIVEGWRDNAALLP